MLSVNLGLRENSYDITVGSGILKDLGASLKTLNVGKDAIVITNPKIKLLHGRVLASGLKRNGFTVKFFEVPDGERSKSVKTAVRLIENIVDYNVRRDIFIVAFGGGVVGDLVGFVAAVYKRGVPFIQVPTTFLAQIDSAIGGKVAVDLPAGKNLIGAFYQPKLVWSDVDLLTTLTKRQIRNGLGEAVKYGVISDKSLFDYIEMNAVRLLAADPKILKEVVYHCSRIKAKVVMSDEKETKGIRTILNFGHTVGHAIEAANKYQSFHHGEAIGLGMCVAVDISRRLGLLSADAASHIKKVLQDIGLPVKIQKTKLSSILKHMRHDKKFQAGQNRFVLATGIGSVKILCGIKNSIVHASIKANM